MLQLHERMIWRRPQTQKFANEQIIPYYLEDENSMWKE